MVNFDYWLHVESFDKQDVLNAYAQQDVEKSVGLSAENHLNILSNNVLNYVSTF